MLMLMFVMSSHLVFMFSWSPIGPLLCGSTIASPLFRASELSHHCIHGVYPTSFYTLLSPSILFAWFLSCVASYDLQPHCPLSPSILCQSLPCHSCHLCSKQGKLSIRHSTLPVSTIIISVCLSVALLLFSRALVEDLSLPHLRRTSFCRPQHIYSRSKV